LFPAIILAQGLGQTFGAAPFLVIAVVILLQLLVGAYAYRWLRGPRMTRRQLAFALGLLAPIASLGFIAQFPIEIVAVADAALVVWFLRMLRAAESEVRGDRSASPPPLGAGSGAI
jgi:multisubunit Na+/H+ antiporter MnhF subunit